MFRSFIKSSAVYSSDKNDCPEKRLFIAILSQAVHDAFSDHVPPFEKRAARNFLTSNSSDFQLICEMAGRSHAYVREKIERKFFVIMDGMLILKSEFRLLEERNK